LQEHVRETLVPSCYVSFSGLVGDSQFANLGVVLFALLTEIAAGEDGVGVPRRAEEEDGQAQARPYRLAGSDTGVGQETSRGGAQVLVGTSTRITGEDQGEVIERVYESGDGDEIRTPTTSTEEVVPAIDGKEEQQQQGQPIAEHEDKTKPIARKSTKPSKRKKPGVTEEPSEERSQEKTKKRNKKQKDTIDDLFSGLM